MDAATLFCVDTKHSNRRRQNFLRRLDYGVGFRGHIISERRATVPCSRAPGPLTAGWLRRGLRPVPAIPRRLASLSMTDARGELRNALVNVLGVHPHLGNLLSSCFSRNALLLLICRRSPTLVSSYCHAFGLSRPLGLLGFGGARSPSCQRLGRRLGHGWRLPRHAC